MNKWLTQCCTLWSESTISKGYKTDCQSAFVFWTWAERDYPPNLSISIRGGKETNRDSLSNGEWTGKSSNLNRLVSKCGVWDLVCNLWYKLCKLAGMQHRRGWQSRYIGSATSNGLVSGVELFVNATQRWRYASPKAKYQYESDSEQVPWGKVEKHFEKRVKSTWNR